VVFLQKIIFPQKVTVTVLASPVYKTLIVGLIASPRRINMSAAICNHPGKTGF
jgi:hypothetical protein